MSLYDKLYEKGKEFIKEMNKPLAKRRDARAFKTAYDEVLEQKDSATQRLSEIYEKKLGKFADYIDEIIQLYRTAEAADETLESVRKCYKEIFDKELKVDEE